LLAAVCSQPTHPSVSEEQSLIPSGNTVQYTDQQMFRGLLPTFLSLSLSLSGTDRM